MAEQQVTDLRGALEERAIFWRNRFYSNAYSTAGHDLVDTDLDSTGALKFFAGSNGASAPVQHIANASALRSSLLGFFVAFWEHLLTVRGGLKLIVFDDPQELLDDDNRDRLARALNELAGSGAQLIVTTHDRSFARLTVAEGRKRSGVEHRSVHPVNAVRNTVDTAPAIEELDNKRSSFERKIDDAVAAQDYVSEARVFIEARLADLFDDPSYPAFSAPSKAPTLSDHLSRLRGLVGSPPNDLFGRRSFADFARDPALQDGAACITALNTSHHNKSSITYRQVSDVQDDLKRLRSVEKLHEEFRGWRWRDPDPEVLVENVPLDAVLKPSFEVTIFPDLAAFTGGSLRTNPQEVAEDRFEGAWFEDKALYFVRNENLGFAAPSGSIVVVECDPKPGNDRNLVIALKGDRVYARRLLRATTNNSSIALSAQTADPRKSPPTILADPSKIQIHRILGVLFDDISPPSSKEEAVLIDDAPCLKRVETAYLVRDESALPLALPGQLVLGGSLINPDELAANEQRPVAITLTDGSSIFKRVGPSLPGSMAHLRLFESIGGLGASEIVATEEIEGRSDGLPVMAFARLVVGVLYEH